MTIELEPLPDWVPDEPLAEWVSSIGPCTSICDAASNAPGPRSGCYTPWCKCQCHKMVRVVRHAQEVQARREAAYVDMPLRWEGDDS